MRSSPKVDTLTTKPAETNSRNKLLTTSNSGASAPVRLRAGMRRGGATGAPPASHSRHHDRSRPAPPAPVLRNGAGGAGRSLCPYQLEPVQPRWGNVSHTARGGVDNHHDAPAPRGTNLALRARDHSERAQTHDRRSPLHPRCFATGVPGSCGSHSDNSTALPLRDLRRRSQFQPRRPQPSRQARKDKSVMC
jgi:hypothetical protein